MQPGVFARLGMRLADWSQRWFPDPFVFALVGLIVVFVAGMFAGIGMRDLIKYFGDGFWALIPFTMQMAMIIIGGYVVATSPPVHKLIQTLAKIPRTPRQAVAFVVFFSMATSLVSWGLSLIFSGVLVREIVRHVVASTTAQSASPLIWAPAACGLWDCLRPPHWSWRRPHPFPRRF